MKKTSIKSTAQNVQFLLKDLDANIWGFLPEGAIDYDYEVYNPCYDGSDCCDDDYCRCGTIINTHINSVNTVALSKKFTSYFTDEFDIYCVDRLVSASELSKESSWEVSTIGGYYGEEVHGVQLSSHLLLKQLNEWLISLSKAKSNFDKIKLTLEAEYGYLIPSLEGKLKASIIRCPITEIQMGNDEYMRKINKDIVDYYSEYTLPRAVCVKNVWPDTARPYRLIDGYHRTTAALQNKVKNIKIIMLERD